jgi:hypothetical protein
VGRSPVVRHFLTANGDPRLFAPPNPFRSRPHTSPIKPSRQFIADNPNTIFYCGVGAILIQYSWRFGSAFNLLTASGRALDDDVLGDTGRQVVPGRLESLQLPRARGTRDLRLRLRHRRSCHGQRPVQERGAAPQRDRHRELWIRRP